jgi:scyllo-inositol 2-dehydrogenase (NADP+)
MSSSPDPIGVGIAGYGLAGRVFHRTLIAHTPGLRLRAVCTRSEARQAQAAAELPSASIYAGFDGLLEDRSVDLVVVATPHDTHADFVIQAAQAGKHVVVDKLMCLTVDEGERMIAAARSANVIFSVFQNRRWDTDYLTLKQVLDSGILGEVFVVESAVTSFGVSRGYALSSGDRPRGWRTYAEFGGGPMRDWGAHLFDQAVQLAGPRPDRVFADFQFRRDWDVETAACAWLRYPPRGGARDGLRFSIETGAISAIPKPRWLVRGSEGAYEQYGRDPQEAALQRGEVGPQVMDREHSPRLVRVERGEVVDVPVEQVPGDYRAFYANVAHAIQDGAPLAVQPIDVLASVRLLLAAADAAATGETVRLDDQTTA